MGSRSGKWPSIRMTRTGCSWLSKGIRMGRAKSAEGLTLLLEVASTPVKRRELNPEELALPIEEVVNKFDVRLAAIRSLSNYANEPRAIQVLVKIMLTEREVALKNRSHESLLKITGAKVQPDSQAWLDWMKSQSIPPLPMEQSVPQSTTKK